MSNPTDLARLCLDELLAGHLRWRGPFPEEDWARRVLERYFGRLVPEKGNGFLTALLARIRRPLSRPDPWETQSSVELTARAILRRASDQPLSRTSITREDAAADAIVTLVREAHNRGIELGAKAAAETHDWLCVCTCRAHGRRGCPLCQHVELCPVHVSVEPADLRPDVLTDAITLEQALTEAYAAAVREDGGSEGDATQWQPKAMREALRRTVCVRVSKRG